MKSSIIPEPAPTTALKQVSPDEALMKSFPMAADKWMAAVTGKEEVPVPVQLEVQVGNDRTFFRHGGL